jgi:hypothetical protein
MVNREQWPRPCLCESLPGCRVCLRRGQIKYRSLMPNSAYVTNADLVPPADEAFKTFKGYGLVS